MSGFFYFILDFFQNSVLCNLSDQLLPIMLEASDLAG
jgi:hypothetical protein